MVDEIKTRLQKFSRQRLNLSNIGLYLFVLIVAAIAWSSVKTIQANYELQKQISSIKQQNEVLQLANQNVDLQNQYFKTDQYLELAARQSLGLAAPGEKILLIPKNVAMKYIDPSLIKQYSVVDGNTIDHRSRYIKNLEAWRDFLLGHNLTADTIRN